MNNLEKLINFNTNGTTFLIESGEMILSDPGYQKGIWCQKRLDRVKCGEWEAFINRNDEGRVSILFAKHVDTDLSNIDWSRCDDIRQPTRH